MGINNEGIINRRQLLVKAGSFMKLSWRKSREKLSDDDDDNRKSRRRRRGNLFVQFSDELCVVPSNLNEPLSDEEIENRWYQSSDYTRFKKDTILTSLNYINARRASKPFDETINCIWGIENMCILPAVCKRYIAEKKYVYKVIREEQTRQKKELQEQQQQQQQQQEPQFQSKIKNGDANKTTSSSRAYPDLEKFRSVSVSHTKGERDRALARGNEYARAQQRSLGLGGLRNPSSMKNLFASFRTQSAAAAS